MTDLKFQTWLTLNESTKISDYLKTLDKSNVQAYKNFIYAKLNLKKQHIDIVANYFAYLYMSEAMPLSKVPSQIESDWGKYRAYITDTLDNNRKNNLSLIGFNRFDLDVENIKYHHELTIQKGTRKGPEGHPVVNISNALQDFKNNHPTVNLDKNFLPEIWHGWNWVSLGCGFSSEEGAAGGHCGNSGGDRGDNIYSLRDGSNRVHLTFIVNVRNGNLGEAKAADNNKPSDNYHPAIISLFLSGYIKGVDQNNTYIPENNFVIEDLKSPIKEIVIDFLNGKEDHKRPENYLPWEWIYKWDQSSVDAMSASDKMKFLKETLKVIRNYDPFTTHDYVYDSEGKSGYKKRPDFEVPNPIHFDLNSLALECLDKFQKIKPLLEILADLQSISSNLLGADSKDWKLWFPEDETKEFDYNRVKSPSYAIKWDTIESYAKKAVKLSKDGSTRDKSNLIDNLNEIGQQDSGEPHYQELKNKFETEIKTLESEIVDEVIDRGFARKVEFDYVNTYIHRGLHPYDLPDKPLPNDDYYAFIKAKRKVNHHIQTTISKDGKKLIGSFQYSKDAFSKLRPGKASKFKEGVPLTKQEYEFFQTADKIYHKHIDLLKRKGHSQFLGEGKFFTILKNHLMKLIELDSKKHLKHQFKESSHDDNGGGIKVFVPIVEGLKSIQAGNVPNIYKKIDEAIGEVEIKAFYRNLKTLERWVVDNASNISAETNYEAKYSKKDDRLVNVLRPVTKRHHSPQFREWVKIRESMS